MLIYGCTDSYLWRLKNSWSEIERQLGRTGVKRIRVRLKGGSVTVRFNVWSSTSRNYTLASMLAVWGQRALEHSRMTALRCVKLLAPACYLSERFNKYWGHLRVRRTRMRMKCSTELSLGRTRIRMNLRKPILRGHQRAVQWRTFQMIKRSNMDLNRQVELMVASLGAASDQKQ